MKLRVYTTVAYAAALALSLSACATPGGGDTKGTNDLFAKILTDPACSHDDKITVITGAGGIPASVQGSAERHCPMPTGAKPPT